jgi:putative peptidoglycan lipid II flippase
MQKVLQPLYFAREDTRTPFRFALVAMAVNAVAAILCAYLFGFIGAALGTTIAGWAMVLLLASGCKGMGQSARFDSRFHSRIGRIILAALAMGALLWGLAWLMEPWLFHASVRYPALALLVLAGIVSYFSIGQVIGAFRLAEFKTALRRSPKQK